MNEVLSTLAGQEVDESVIEQGFIGSNQQNAGCFIKVSVVHSISDGVIIAVEKDPTDSTKTVTVEVDSQHWIRYCRLCASSKFVGAKIQPGDFIGYSDRGLMKLEYCTAEKSQFPVRIIYNQLYKQDPASIIFGGV